MATTNYRLKKGYIAQFDIPFKGIKAFSNDQMTDELAQEFLKRHPSRSIYFEVHPPLVKVTPSEEDPIKKVKPEVKDDPQPGNFLAETMKDINKPEVIPAEKPQVKVLSKMNKAELVKEASKYKDIENPAIYNKFDLANLIRKALGIKEIIKAKK